MTAPNTPPLLRTGLYDLHRALGARMVPFSGWEMPLQYTGILAEARAVRTALGLFDVSHMGRLHISGQGAVALLDRLVTARVDAMRPGRVRYGFVLNQEGGIIDDVTVARLPDTPRSLEEAHLLVPNAGNREAVRAWLKRWAEPSPQVVIADTTQETVMIAVQGPQAAATLEAISSTTVSSLRAFTQTELTLGQSRTPILVSRTGYTGEDGFELIAPREEGPALWSLLQEGGGVPCGLGARDTLRLEAGLSLHGTDIDSSTTPLEAGLERFVPLESKEEFLGREALVRQNEQGLRRRLVGFTLLERGIPRHGYALVADGRPVGSVTSGGYSPTLDTGIGMGYVAPEHAAPGASLTVDLRGRPVPARVVELPFYRRPSGQERASDQG